MLNSYASTDKVTRTKNFEYVNIGEGTLLSQKKLHYYRVAQFSNLGANLEEVKQVLEQKCNEEKGCVGYHVHTNEKNGQYLHGALLFDADNVAWPYKTPMDWVALNIRSTWMTKGGADCKNQDWCGAAPPSLSKASVSVNKGWYGWQAFAKKVFSPNRSNYK